MKLTVTCQLCGKVLSVVEKDQVTEQDIQDYESMMSCSTVQSDGVTVDGQSDIQVTKTVD